VIRKCATGPNPPYALAGLVWLLNREGLVEGSGMPHVLRPLPSLLFEVLRPACALFFAQVDGVNEDGTTDFRETYKVSALIKGSNPIEWYVRIAAKVFRIVTEEDEKVPDSPLMVVLRRKRGDYCR